MFRNAMVAAAISMVAGCATSLSGSPAADMIVVRSSQSTPDQVVDRIKAVPTGNMNMYQNVPVQPVTIEKATCAR